MNSFEKPRDWGIAPKETWVQGKPIGQSEIRMPSLGDPGAHENSSSPLSFGDDAPDRDGALYQGRKVEQCPPGMTSENGVCTPNPKSEAKPETIFKARVKGQWGDDEEGKGRSKPGQVDPSFKRKLPEAPMRGAVSRKPPQHL